MRSERNKTKSGDDVPVHDSSGNVFEDLGLAQSAELLAKAELTSRIADSIERRELTQVEASKLLGIDQPSLSKLLRGQLAGFSTDRLFRFLNSLGRDVEIRITPCSNSSKKPGIRVVTSRSRKAG